MYARRSSFKVSVMLYYGTVVLCHFIRPLSTSSRLRADTNGKHLKLSIF